MEPAQDEVLTLHHTVLARLAPAVHVEKSRHFLASVGKAERLMAQLPGLSGAIGGFSMRAWSMATAMLETPSLCGRLGMAARALRLDELAELVQVVLEETEAGGEAFADAGLALGSAARTNAAAGVGSPKRAVRHAGERTGRPIQARANLAQPAVKQQVQRVLREVRQALHAADAAAVLQKPGPVDPSQAGSVDLSSPDFARAQATSAAALLGAAKSLEALPLDRFRAAERQSIRRIPAHAAWTARGGAGSPTARVASSAEAGGFRASGSPDIATERAFLAVGSEAPAEAGAIEAVGGDAVVQAPGSPRPAGVAALAGAPSRRSLSAALAGAATSARMQAAASRSAVSPSAAIVQRPAADPASVRLAAMAPRWQRTLGAWADADRFAPNAKRPRRAIQTVDDAARQDRRERTPGAAEQVARAFAAEPVAELVHATPAIDDEALTQGWSAQALGTTAHRASGAGYVGLQMGAAMRALVQRHSGGIQVPDVGANANRSLLRAWRTQEAERTPIALTAEAADEPSLQPDQRATSQAAPKSPPWAQGVTAVVSAVVAQAARWTGLAPHRKAPNRARGVLGLLQADALGQPDHAAAQLPARPLGRVDALSPWLDQAAGPTRSLIPAPSGELTWLQPDDAGQGDAAEAEMAAPGVRMLAAGTAPPLVPSALRAAFAVLGERSSAMPDGSRAAAYVARFFGRTAPAAAQDRSAERTQLRFPADEIAETARTGSGANGQQVTGRQSVGIAADGATPGPVLRGAAALEALLAGPAATDALLARAESRERQVPDAERTLLTPPPAAPGARRTDAARPAWPSAQLHHFSPVGLGRGRGLLARAGRSAGRAPLQPRATNARPTGAASWTVARTALSGGVGYGPAALGGGELLGLHPDDASGFFGEVAETPHGLRGAHALASWMAGRRAGGLVPGERATTQAAREGAAGTFVQPEGAEHGGLGEAMEPGPRNVPANFSYQQAAGATTYGQSPQATLVEAGGAASRQADAVARVTGPSAAARATQASRMARVLSVTDSPTGNMLPLVAPAAHAVVTAAAAKPQSEHIVTSGYGPSQGTATQSAAQSGPAGERPGDAAHGQDAQDFDALAARIARSVLLRMQRERERRGQYG